jgi:hypothetical protein
MQGQEKEFFNSQQNMLCFISFDMHFMTDSDNNIDLNGKFHYHPL